MSITKNSWVSGFIFSKQLGHEHVNEETGKSSYQIKIGKDYFWVSEKNISEWNLAKLGDLDEKGKQKTFVPFEHKNKNLNAHFYKINIPTTNKLKVSEMTNEKDENDQPIFETKFLTHNQVYSLIKNNSMTVSNWAKEAIVNKDELNLAPKQADNDLEIK
ncbi:hypothetical protein [Williamsoniiplasma lucivorax]|uniref:Uncharacterized protein n=1 Tax=Williamsoniiplasma lucivorax TaxID=209274 RepID=A0A2S5RDV7_9MOLU|nr:hypothetical protein [Williamsoniiplasma lucivorax]PPE05392.1 hypothetical protein ELUCI_v1c04840 [Williamsoniiplasma lucivorax]